VSTGATRLWTIGERPQKIAGEAAAADLATGTLFVETPEGYGPTRICAPAAPSWSADVEPEDISPDGALVVVDAGHTVQIRRVDTGAVVGTLGLRPRFGDVVTWEDDGHNLVMVPDRGRSVLVRCSVAGECERAGDWERSRITVRFTTQY
jgi:hypothetical protein